MVPFLHLNLMSEEERYNKALCKTRSRFECTLGILQNRFGAILKKLHVHGPDYACKVITACLVLHNICVENCDHFDTLPQGCHMDPSEPMGDNSTAAGKAKCQQVVQMYFT